MTPQEALDHIEQHHPSLVYLTGKTSTGKTTFSNLLHNYSAVALDQVVYDTVITPFGLAGKDGDVFISVYNSADNSVWLDAFVTGARKRIASILAQNQRVVIEGAIANADIVHQILSGVEDVDFLYFHPAADPTGYIRNLTARFMGTSKHDHNGLPRPFWEYIDEDAFKIFCDDGLMTQILQDNIAQYAAQSTAESAERMATLRKRFPTLCMVTV